ncbi:MAG: amino acid adenylation domain-containing protein [Candidatus Sericytochromatia bacterium]
MSEPLAIVGMACRFPGAPDLLGYWDLLQTGRDAVGPPPPGRWPEATGEVATALANGGFLGDISGFDSAFFGLSDQEADALDPQQRLVLELSRECLEDAGLLPAQLSGSSTGVFLGLSSADYTQQTLHHRDQVDMYTITGAATSVVANRLSYLYDWQGPSLVVDTACSSSLVALHLAAQSLARGECSRALVGGVQILLSPLLQLGFAQAQALSPTGRCRPFGAAADGMVRGEGGGLICLEPLAEALAAGRRIYALIAGSAVGQDGQTNGLSAPSPAGQRRVLAQAWQAAQASPNAAWFIEAHGTGTPLGDPIEAQALRDLWQGQRDTPCRLGSVKSQVGHLEAAAGIAGLIKAALALHHGWLPASLHAAAAHPRIPFASWQLQLQTEGEALPPEARLAGVSAFGFGGTNAHVVLARHAAAALPAAAPAPFHILPLSARSAAALEADARRLAQWLPHQPSLSLATLAASLTHQREALPWRRAVVADSPSAAQRAWEQLEAPPAPLKSRRPRLVFLFSGMGSQESGMGQFLLADAPSRTRLQELDSLLTPAMGQSLLPLLAHTPSDPTLLQPLLFALQLTVVDWLAARGIRPEAVMGSSMGEITAACVAGILTEAEAAQLICRRIQLLAGLRGSGSLAVVGRSAAELEAELQGQPLWVAAINAPQLCVVAGEDAALHAQITRWRASGVFVRPVKGADAPSHTPLMAPLRAPLAEALAPLRPHKSALPFWSTVTGQETPGERLDADYWWQNLSQPVQLWPSLEALTRTGPVLCIEISPHPVLAPALQGQPQLEVLGSLERGGDDEGPLYRLLAQLWERGFAPDWPRLNPQAPPLTLPARSWRRQRHWRDPLATAHTADPGALVPGAHAPDAVVPGVTPSAETPEDLHSRLLRTPPSERQAVLASHLQQTLAASLKLSLAELPLAQPLKHLGIGSLVGMELYNRIRRELKVQLALSEVLRGPSLEELAGLILTQLDAAAPAETERPSTETDRAPLSFVQRRFWFYEQLQPGTWAYHIPVALELRGPLDRARLQTALLTLSQRHPLLRTVYREDAHGQPFQQVLDTVPLQYSEGVLSTPAQPALEQAARQPFALSERPPFRLTLFGAAPDHHWLLIDLHHLVADGYTFKLLFAELAALYTGQSPGPVPPAYAHYAHWQAEQAAQNSWEPALRWWTTYLAEAPLETRLPADAVASSAPGQRHSFWLDAARLQGLESLTRQLGVSLYSLLLGAFLLVLERLGAGDDLVIGTPVLGRDAAQWENVIGPFLNMLPLRMQIDARLPLQDWLARLHETVLAAFDHQQLPFDVLVEAINPPRRLDLHPLYQVVFALHAPVAAERLGDLAVTPHAVDLGISRFDLALTLHPERDGLSGSLEYRSSRHSPRTMVALAQAWLTLLDQFAHGLQQPLQHLQLAPWQPVLSGEAPGLLGPSLATQIQHWVIHTPQAEALRTPEGSLSYGALGAQAAALAERLQTEQRERVGVWLPRGPETLRAWLACLWAGVSCLPLDPDAPPARLERLLSEAKVDLLLSSPSRCERLPAGLSCPVWALEADAPANGDSRRMPLRPFAPDQPVYLIYTSGSSGRPKAVAVGEASLLHLLNWHRQHYAPAAGERISQLAHPAFDAAVWEIWSALSSGACLSLPADTTLRDPEALRNWLADEQIALAFVPTPLLERLLALPAPVAPALRALLTGGDRLQRRPSPDWRVPIWNHYGPTENTVVTSWAAVSPARSEKSETAPAIGQPLPGQQLYLVDRAGQPLPAELPGELWIGGSGLALGYAEDPARSAAAFVSTPAGRLYRSGDRVRVDGTELHYLGRQDRQVQIRGVRVEPAEIEALLLQHPAVLAAAVLAHEGQLWAVVSPEQDVAALRSWLQTQLPSAWLPTGLFSRAELPLNARGKHDRAALSAWLVSTLESQPAAFAEPQTLSPSEALLLGLWRELLPGVSLGPESDFFSLGGHSLLALDLRHRLVTEAGRDLPLEQIFARPRLRDLAAWLDQHSPEPAETWPALTPGDLADNAPFALSEVQQAYWIGRQSGLAGEAGLSTQAYLELALPTTDSLSPARLESALRHLIDHHPMLRAVVHPDGSQQVLSGAQLPPWHLPLHDLRACSPAACEAALAAIRARLSDSLAPSDRWPLFGVELSLLPESATTPSMRLHLRLEALVADATSYLLLARQLETLLNTPTDQWDEALPRPQLRFADVMRHQPVLEASARFARAEAWWRERLDSLPPPPDLPLQAGSDHGPFVRRSGRLQAASWRRLQQQAQAAGVSANALLLSAFGGLLACWQEQQPLTLNLTTFQRWPIHPEIHQLVGDFTQLTLIGIRPEADFLSQTRAVQAELLGALEHGLYGGVRVMRDLRARTGSGSMPVVFTSLVGAGEARLPLNAERVYSRTQTPGVWLDHQLAERDGALCYDWDFPEQRFVPGLIEALFAAWESLLKKLAAAPNLAICLADTLPRPALATASLAAAEAALLHAAWARQALEQPARDAVLSPARSLTHGRLLAESWALAQRLRPLLRSPESRVAIQLHPGWEQAVAVLGTLLAGGVWVPFHPDWPAARVASLCARTRPVALLSEPARQAALGAALEEHLHDTDTLTAPPLWTLAPAPEAPLPTRPELEAALAAVPPESLAYVIFTSGSTGEPKGVMMTHAATWNTIADLNTRLAVGADDRILGLSALSFDLAVYDLLGPLSQGGALVLPDPDGSRDPAHWLARCQTESVTLWNSVPALLDLLVSHAETRGEGPLPRLRAVLLSGDWIPVDLPQRLHAQLAPTAQILGLGGATEAAIWSVAWPIDAVDPSWSSIPYGHALAGQSIQVVSDNLAPCPLWAPGEMVIGGVGLAQGYWEDPAQTATRFVHHPHRGERLYRTGDRGRLRPDGSLEFLGRRDFQVKIQGHRIELGEIETTLQRHPDVQQAVVTVLGERSRGQLLAAWRGDTPLNAETLRAWLGERLPPYMLPVHWLPVTAFPLSGSGKIDRRALGVLAAEHLAQQPAAAPRPGDSPWVARLRPLLETELGLVGLDPERDLLTLGVDSLAVIRLGNRLEAELGHTPGVGQLFRLRSLSALASYYAEQASAAPEQATPPSQALLADVAARQAFAQRPVTLSPDQARQALPARPPAADSLDWRSTRAFGSQAVSTAQLSGLLAVLAPAPEAPAQRRYASAGSLYPVQVWLQTHGEPQTALGAGIWRYLPGEHSLSAPAVAPESRLWRPELHLSVNQDWVREAAFSLYLVGDLDAIAPLYGADARDYCLLEAGAMAQLLRQAAPGLQLGLCAVGQVDTLSLSEPLGLSERQLLLHTLVGGVLPPADTPPAEDWEEWVF